MLEITYDQIMSFNPCYDPAEIGMPKDYKASLRDFITEYRDKVKNKDDIHWVMLRKEFFNDRDLRLFGVWSASQVEHLMQDARSTNALNVSEQYAFGEVDDDALDAARAAAFDAARAAARDACDAAWDTARDAACDAALAAALDAALDACDAARAAARDAQIEKILEMIDKPNGAWYVRRIKQC